MDEKSSVCSCATLLFCRPTFDKNEANGCVQDKTSLIRTMTKIVGYCQSPRPPMLSDQNQIFHGGSLSG